MLARHVNQAVEFDTPSGVVRVIFLGYDQRNRARARLGIEAPADVRVLREELRRDESNAPAAVAEAS